MSELLFVYGTLRRTGGHDLEKMFSDAVFWGEAEFSGEMFLVDYFPGVIDSTDPRARIVGEVYELDAAGRSLAKLDEFEDYRKDDPAAGVYRREKRQVKNGSGNLQEVWVYLYKRPVDDFRRIESGDFVRFLKESQAASME